MVIWFRMIMIYVFLLRICIKVNFKNYGACSAVEEVQAKSLSSIHTVLTAQKILKLS